MKQMKFLLVAIVTVLMGMSVTSCLSSDDNHVATLYSVPVKYSFSGFVMGDGVKLVPNKQLDYLTGTYYVIDCQYDQSQVNDKATSISVSMLSDPINVDPKSNERLTETKTEPTNPFYALDQNSFGLRYYDKNTICLFMPYWVKVAASTADQEAEFAKHSFIISYDPQAINPTDTKLNFYLSHVVKDEEGEAVKREKYTSAGRAYAINMALADFKQITGNIPAYLTFTAETNSLKDAFQPSNGTNTVEYQYPFK